MAEPNKDTAIRPVGGPPSLIYRSVRAFTFGIYRTYFRAGVIGAENIPESGPCMILANHASLLDPPAVGALLNREIHFLARDGLFGVPLIGPLIRALNSHPIRREGIDREAIKTCVRILETGWPLLLFPEGTRSPDGKVTKPRGGFGMILEKVPDVPCLPMIIRGTDRALGRGMNVPRPAKITLHIGKPFRIASRAETEPRRDFYDRCATQVEEHWRKLGAYG